MLSILNYLKFTISEGVFLGNNKLQTRQYRSISNKLLLLFEINSYLNLLILLFLPPISDLNNYIQNLLLIKFCI